MAYIIHRIEKLHSINARKRHNERTEGTVKLVQSTWTDASIVSAYKARRNAVKGIEAIYSGSPETIEKWDDKTLVAYAVDCIEFHKRHYGSIIASAVIHLDESSIHIHIISIPVDERNKLNARALVGDRAKMQQTQTDIAEQIGIKYGLERGEPNSTARHEKLQSRTQANKERQKAQERIKIADNVIEQYILAQQEIRGKYERYTQLQSNDPTL